MAKVIADEIASIIKERIDNFELEEKPKINIFSVGTVTSINGEEVYREVRESSEDFKSSKDVFTVKPKRKRAIVLTGNQELVNSKAFELAAKAAYGNTIGVKLCDSESIKCMEKLAYEPIVFDEDIKPAKPKDWYRKFEKKKWR